jgi:hypothetical protein
MNLLPGVRELRTPLACGYVWLLSLWLLFHDRFSTRSDAAGVYKTLLQASDFLGKGPTIAALSFAAFILGSLVEIRASGFFLSFAKGHRIFRAFMHPNVGLGSVDLTWRVTVTPVAFRALLAHVHHLGGFHGAPRPDYLSGVHPDLVAASTLRQRSQLATKLHLESPELYGDFDRKAAEADFKLNMGIALVVLCFSLVYQGVAFAAFGVLLGGLLVQRSFGALRVSNDVLVEAVIAEKINSVPLANYVDTVQQLHAMYRTDEPDASSAEGSAPPEESGGRPRPVNRPAES